MAYGQGGRGQGRPMRQQGAVRPRRPGLQNRNRQGQMEQLLKDAMLGRQIRTSRMQRNAARGRRPGGPARPPKRRGY